MNWLKKIWDEYSWILFLPFILLIGILVIIAVIGIRYSVIFFFNAVPFSIWGSLLGGAITFLVGWYLSDKISESKQGFGWNLVTQISPIGIGLGLLGLVVLAASIIFIFLPQDITSAWNLIQTIGFSIIAIVFLYAYIFVCGTFFRDGILAFRFDTIWGGVVLTLIAIVGITPIIAIVYDYLAKSYLQQFWLGTIAGGAVLTLIGWFIISYFAIPAFYFQLEENKKDESD
ncbi:MAG: hypothetical protein AAB336_07225 [Acidobacteriota bacterium]